MLKKMAAALGAGTNAPVDFDKSIPSPEEVDSEYKALLERRDILTAELKNLEDDDRKVMADLAAEMRTDVRRAQVDALLRGVEYEPPVTVREKMAANSKRRQLVNEALHELGNKISGQHRKASAKIAQTFEPERLALAKEFFEHLAAAVAVHARYGDLRDKLEKAGVDATGLRDFGADLLGPARRRNDHAAYHLRYGVRFGHIDAASVPEGYL